MLPFWPFSLYMNTWRLEVCIKCLPEWLPDPVAHWLVSRWDSVSSSLPSSGGYRLLLHLAFIYFCCVCVYMCVHIGMYALLRACIRRLKADDTQCPRRWLWAPHRIFWNRFLSGPRDNTWWEWWSVTYRDLSVSIPPALGLLIWIQILMLVW